MTALWSCVRPPSLRRSALRMPNGSHSRAGCGADGSDTADDAGRGAGRRLRRSGRSRAAVPVRTTGGAGDLPAGRQRLQHADVTAGYLDIAATLKFSEDAIDHVA